MATLTDPLFYLALATLGATLLAGLDLVRGLRSLTRLEEVEPLAGPDLPAVSIVIPARNEERKLPRALRSVLDQEYPRLQVVAIDDRSTDATPQILAEHAARDSRLHVLSISELPDGWLGKNWALDRGARVASGEFLIFADADVVMKPSTVARAVSRMRSEGLDHLTAFPQFEPQGPLYNALVRTFGLFLTLYLRPWKAADPDSRLSLGIGAFNMVRAEFYRSVEGHERIALRPDDDLRLAQLLKANGARAEAVVAIELLAVEWYESTREMVRGLMKNSFAAANYRLREVAAASAGQLLFIVWPFAAVWVTGGAALALNVAIVLGFLFIYAYYVRFFGEENLWSALYGLTLPLAALAMVYIIWRSAILALVRGRIEWRSTEYSLEELRSNRL